MSYRYTYNETLCNTVDYRTTAGIKRIFNLWTTLERLARHGDQVAIAFMADLKTCLGEYPHSPTTLTDDEILLIKQNLIYGYSQKELAIRQGVTQKTISQRITIAVRKISKMLEGGE